MFIARRIHPKGLAPLGVSQLVAGTSIYVKETFARRRQKKARCYDAIMLQVAKAVFAMVHDCPFRSLVSGSASISVVTHSLH